MNQHTNVVHDQGVGCCMAVATQVSLPILQPCTVQYTAHLSTEEMTWRLYHAVSAVPAVPPWPIYIEAVHVTC